MIFSRLIAKRSVFRLLPKPEFPKMLLDWVPEKEYASPRGHLLTYTFVYQVQRISYVVLVGHCPGFGNLISKSGFLAIFVIFLMQ